MKRVVSYSFLITFASGICLVASANILDLFSWDLPTNNENSRDGDSDSEALTSCNCNGASCMCCADFNFTYFDLGGPGCVSMKYISQKDGLSVNVSYGESLLHSQQVKGENPEPICMGVLANLAQICAQFKSLKPNNNGLKGCLQIEPVLLEVSQTHFDIGCFTMGPNEMKMEPFNTTAENGHKNSTQSEDVNEEELMSSVNETAQQGLIFIGNLLDYAFGKPDDNSTNSETSSEAPNSPSTKSPE